MIRLSAIDLPLYVNMEDLIEKNKCLYNKKTSKKFSGIAIEYHKINKIKILEVKYLNGKKHGKYQSWFIDGEKKQSGNYLNGQFNGEFIGWYKSGRKKFIAQFLNDMGNGENIKWYRNGKRELVENWKNGEANGAFKRWFENGNIELDEYWVDNSENGEHKGWFLNGKKRFVKKFDKGKLVSSVEWYANGKLRSKAPVLIDKKEYDFNRLNSVKNITYLNGSKKVFSGIAISIDPKTNIKLKHMVYVRGKKNGLQSLYYDNGNSHIKGNYIDNKKDGEFKIWFLNNQIQFLGSYMENKEDGKQELWFNNGQRKSVGNYVDGKRYGKFESWYENGNKNFVQILKNDKLMSLEKYNKDGSLNKKEYYNDKGVFIKRELYKDNKLTKTETTE